ncbi:MauE/DoxX family redox-associated membrane protein [Sphingobium scionense]
MIAGLAPVPVLLAMLLLSLFAGAMAINIARGRSHIDCGCGRSQLRHPIGWPLVIRNLLLVALVAPRLLPTPPLSVLDIATAAAGGIALFLAFHLLGAILALIATPAAAYRR